MTDMADTSEKIKNYTVAVKERGKNIKFCGASFPVAPTAATACM